MDNHDVAVLMSVYNKDKLDQVVAAIQSIRHQDYGKQNVHIYLGVDGPIDKKLDAYIREHSSCFWRVVRNQTNQGLAATLNRLIDSLDEEKYAFRMDADDVALPYRFRLQTEYMDAHPAVDICGGSIVEFDDSGHAFMIRNFPRDTQAAKKYICKASPFAHMTVCFRRSLFEDGKYRYPAVKSSQDIRLWHKVLADGKETGNVALPLVLVRMNRSMLKRRSVAYGLREFGAFWSATLSFHGLSWRLGYPLARLTTRLTPGWLNSLIYKRFRRALNCSSKEQVSVSEDPIQCVPFDGNLMVVSKRVLKEICGLPEKEVHEILAESKDWGRAA